MLDLPDVTLSSCTHKMAGTCIWIHLEKKAQSDKMKLHRPMPLALKGHTQLVAIFYNNFFNITCCLFSSIFMIIFVMNHVMNHNDACVCCVNFSCAI